MRNPLDVSVLEPTGLTAVACQDYAGAFSCAAKQEGFTITAKVEQADNFGMNAWLANADWLADEVLDYEAGNRDKWPIKDVDVVFGNPPCSGFSILTAASKWQEAGLHGAEATQNKCMIDLVGYGADCNASVIVFESVQGAATKGRPLMERLHRDLEDETGHDWFLTLVRMNAMSVGGWADRKRFFFVASRLGPVSLPAATGQAHTLMTAIGDLENQFEPDLRFSEFSASTSAKALRHRELAAFYWPQGTSCADAYEEAMKRGYEGPMPDRSDRIQNSFTSWRWRADKPARVITGAGMDTAVHPTQPRTFTYAEVGRIMGFPPEYDLTAIAKLKGAGRQLFGKGIPVQAGRWIMEGVRRHLQNDDYDDDVVGTEINDRLFELDVTNAWRTNGESVGWEQLDIFSVSVA